MVGSRLPICGSAIMSGRQGPKRKRRRHLSAAEKEAKRQSSIAFWNSPEGMLLREKQRQRRIEYNKTEVDKRLSPETRKKSSECLISLNKTRHRSKAEKSAAAERMKAAWAAGKIGRKNPMSEAEKDSVRSRMLGNRYAKGRVQSQAQRSAASARMKKNNPMRVAATVKKMRRTMAERYGEDFTSKFFKQAWADGKIKGKPQSERAKALSRKRMKEKNPMHDAEVVARAMMSRGPKHILAASERMKTMWREGKITPQMFKGKGNVKPANSFERTLILILEPMRGRFVGDGKFWIKKTASGICRNPDFIFGSGRDKIALLLHGTYWHRDPLATRLEIDDYAVAGWSVFVLWTKRLSKWMLPSITQEVESWLSEARSSRSGGPTLRQFMTWNARRITTS